MTAPVDPRLISDPGVRGAFREMGRKVRQGDLGNMPVIVALIGVWIYFWQANHRFISAFNLSNLMLQLAAGGTIALGLVLILLLGEIDLAAGATSGFAAGVMVVLNTESNWNPALAVAAALATGAIVGLIQGLWVTKFRVPSFIVTLAGQLVWTGGLLHVLGKQGSRNVTNQGLLNIGNTFYNKTITWVVAIVLIVAYAGVSLSSRSRRQASGLSVPPIRNLVFKLVFVVGGTLAATITFAKDRGLPLAIIIFIGLIVVVDIVLRRTRFGRHVFAVGGNAEAARRAGINVGRIKVWVFVIAGFLAAAGGILAASRGRGVTQSSGGNDVLLTAVGAAVIGGTSLFGGRGSAWSALLGSLVIFSVTNGMAMLQKSNEVRYIVTGIVLLLAVTIDAIARRGRTSAGRA